MPEDGFVIRLGDFAVKVISPMANARAYLEDEIGSFFCFSDHINRSSHLIGTIYHLPDATVCSEKLEEAEELPLVSFLMHAPKNTPKEIRQGRIGMLSGGETICHSVTKKSVIVASNTIQEIRVFNSHPHEGLKEIRRIVRDQLVVRAAESEGAITVHSACISDQRGRGLLFVGGSGSGKTTFFLQALSQSYDYSGLTCERTQLTRTASGSIAAQGIPEQINVFPGSLRTFLQTEKLVSLADPNSDWVRSHKMKVSWRNLFAAFGSRPPSKNVEVVAVVFPNYTGNEQSIDRIDSSQTLQRVLPEVLTFNDQIRPNWLSWFHPHFASTRQTVQALAAVPGFSISWASNSFARDALTRIYKEVA